MTIAELAAALRGAPHLVGARPHGVLIRRHVHGGFYRISKTGREYPYHPCGSDLEAIDWAAFTVDQYRKMLAQQAAAAADQGDSGSNAA